MPFDDHFHHPIDVVSGLLDGLGLWDISSDPAFIEAVVGHRLSPDFPMPVIYGLLILVAVLIASVLLVSLFGVGFAQLCDL